MSEALNSDALLAIWKEETKKYGSTPAAIDRAIKLINEAITFAYSVAAFRNTNKQSVPGIMRKYSQIWESTCRKIKKEFNFELNENYWSNNLLISLPVQAKKAFPNREAIHNLQAY